MRKSGRTTFVRNARREKHGPGGEVTHLNAPNPLRPAVFPEKRRNAPKNIGTHNDPEYREERAMLRLEVAGVVEFYGTDNKIGWRKKNDDEPWYERTEKTPAYRNAVGEKFREQYESEHHDLGTPKWKRGKPGLPHPRQEHHARAPTNNAKHENKK